jgi:hypothetical protein
MTTVTPNKKENHMTAAPVRVATIRAELRTDSTDVATATPRLTWKTA